MAQPAPVHVALGNIANAFTNAAQSFQAANVAAQAQDAAAPAWVKDMQESLQKLQDNVQKLQEGQEKLQEGQENLRRELIPFRAAAARAHNSAIVADDDSLLGVPASDGQVPPDFPATRSATKALTGPQLKTLLEAYGVVGISRDTPGRILQLGKVTGIRL